MEKREGMDVWNKEGESECLKHHSSTIRKSRSWSCSLWILPVLYLWGTLSDTELDLFSHKHEAQSELFAEPKLAPLDMFLERLSWWIAGWMHCHSSGALPIFFARVRKKFKDSADDSLWAKPPGLWACGDGGRQRLITRSKTPAGYEDRNYYRVLGKGI